MPKTLFADIRYQAIDRCLRDRDRFHFVPDLQEACAQLILERTGRYRKPARRTILGDISIMKSGKLGYEAPIAFSRKTGYYYENNNFSIHYAVFTLQEGEKLYEIFDLLEDFLGEYLPMNFNKYIAAMRSKMNIVRKTPKRPAIFLEKSPNIIRPDVIEKVYKAIKNQQTLNIRYGPFNRKEEFIFLSPYFIKEYNNRWYVIGYDHEREMMINPALDRIIEVKDSLREFKEQTIDHDEFYKDVYGVTIPRPKKIETILFKAEKETSHYLQSKPFHPSLKVIEEKKDHKVFRIELAINFELKQLLLSYGDRVEVLAPRSLRQWIAGQAKALRQIYAGAKG